MIISEFISNIIEITIEGEKFENLLFNQIQYLTENKTEHTGVGVCVYLEPVKGIEKYQLSKPQIDEMFGILNQQLTKFELINSNENVLADLTVHFSNGLIDCVEIWNKLGDYPMQELISYELKRIDTL